MAGWAGSIWERVCQGDSKSLEYIRSQKGEQELFRVDCGGRTLLHWAVDRNQAHVAEYLLELGINPNTSDLSGATALDYVEILFAADFVPGTLKNMKNYQEQQKRLYNQWKSLLAKYNAKEGSNKPFSLPLQQRRIMNDEPDKKDTIHSKFWHTQPIQQQSGPQLFEIEIPNEISWATLEQPDGNEEKIRFIIEEVNNLTKMEDEGSNSLFGGVEFHPTTELLQRVLMKSYVWVGLREKQSQLLVGFIAATKLSIVLHSEEFQCAEVHSLVLHPKYRGRHLTPMLIQALQKQSAEKENISKGIFTTVSHLPIAKISEVKFSYRVLQPRPLQYTPFVRIPEFVTMVQLCSMSMIAKPAKYEATRYHSASDCNDVYALCVHYLSQFPLRRSFHSPKECEDAFGPVTEHTSSFVLRDSQGQMVGAFRLTYLFAKLSSCTTDSLACSAQLGFLAVQNYNDIEELKLLFHHALYQSFLEGAHVLFAQNVLIPQHANSTIFNSFNFQDSDCTLSYHLFNTKFTPLHGSEIGLTFW